MSRIVWAPGEKPEGQNLMTCINIGIPICPDCGRILKRYSDDNGGCDILECIHCGYQTDEMDYEYDDQSETEYYDDDY